MTALFQREEQPSVAPRPDRASRSTGRRPALDGVRALAVLAVVIYHFGGGDSSRLPGGFLGVDIFFVLSGYLITGLLLSEHARTGVISLGAFWVRRVRRLVPALVVMLVAVMAWTWWAVLPENYPARRQDLFWTAGYLANWHFMSSGDDYFAAYLDASPLRHTWSLAVEEQFYLVWPALVIGLLWLGTRLRSRHGLGPLALFAGAGLVLSAGYMALAWSAAAPSAAYYSTQGRVQELFAGALLAVAFAWWRSGRRTPGSGLAMAARFLPEAAAGAVLLLVVALVRMSDTGAFYYRGGALLVSLVVVVLVAGVEVRPASLVARVFSWRPAVALGRISYGVYLWHWPVTVAIPLQGHTREEVLRQVVRVALTLALSIASYWLVERPIQRSRSAWLRRPGRVAGVLVASLALTVGVGMSATALPAGYAREITVSSDRSCPGESFTNLVSCLAPAGASAAQSPRFMLVGDSTGRSLGPGFDQWATGNHATWIEAAWQRCTSSGVKLLPGGSAVQDSQTSSCTQQAPARIQAALATYHPKTVIVAEIWPMQSRILADDGTVLWPGTPRHDQVLLAAYTGLIDQVAAYGGHTVFVEAAPPGKSLGASLAPGRPAATAHSYAQSRARFTAGFNQVLEQAAGSRPGKASTISVTDVVCPAALGGSCPADLDGMVVRKDGTHYSADFSRKIAPIVLQRAGVIG